ncbi:MAG TPA: serine hydrolase, partial [Glaciihabitans sp.]|nr:serine hydrolase [Glaciihabitans sp.]
MNRRVRDGSQGRHRAGDGRSGFARSFAALGTIAYQGAQVSASVIDLKSGTPLLSIDDRVVAPTASLGRLLLLIEVSARLTRHESDALQLLDKVPVDIGGAPGLWQHLQAPALPVIDLASLVAATGDTTATNTLLAAVTLEAVQHRADALGLTRTALLDLARA